MLQLRVRDSGIGIAKDQQERIFQAFQQIDGSISRHYGGTGLGLAITRQLVEVLGGVMVNSELGQGRPSPWCCRSSRTHPRRPRPSCLASRNGAGADRGC